MKSNKIASIAYMVSSICFYIVAIMNFIDEETSQGVIYLCLGSSMLSLATVFYSKNRKK